MFLSFLFLCICLIGTVLNSTKEDLLFRNLQYRVELRKETTQKKNATESYEFIYKGEHDYLCTINVIKEYNEFLSTNINVPEVHGVSSSNMDSYFRGLTSQCLLHYDSDNLYYVYKVCFFSHVSFITFTDDHTVSEERFYSYFSGDEYTDEVLNYDKKRRSLKNLNNFHTQVYKGASCPHESQARYELKIHFYCDRNFDGMFICKTQQLTSCFSEMIIYDNKLCNIPLFQPDFNFTSSSKKIVCEMISDNLMEIAEHPVQAWYRKTVEKSRGYLHNIGNSEGLEMTLSFSSEYSELIRTTRFIAKKDEHGKLRLHSEITKALSDEEINDRMESARFTQFVKDERYFDDVYNNELIINLEASDRNVRFFSDAYMEKESKRSEWKIYGRDSVYSDDDF